MVCDKDQISKALFSTVTQKELCEVIDRIPITKIVLIESRGGKYRKLLLNREGHAYKVDPINGAQEAQISLFNYGMLCDYIWSSNLFKKEHTNRVAIDTTVVELRVFSGEDKQETLRFPLPWIPVSLWRVQMMMGGLSSRSEWKTTNILNNDSTDIWGAAYVDPYINILDEIE